MAIRSVVKALIGRSGSVLLNRCRDAEGRAQRQYEPMEQAPAEEISQDARDRAGYPDHAHRIMHILAADIRGDVPRGEPSELDMSMEECEWVPLAEAVRLGTLRPAQLRGRLAGLAAARGAVWLSVSGAEEE
ncbi:MAG: hypothetical protein ACI4L8_01940 [Candidatus Fimadaptatus sp.]